MNPARWALAAFFAGAMGIAFAPIFVRWSEAGPVATAFWRLLPALPLLALWAAVEERRRPPAGTPAGRPMGVLAGIWLARRGTN